MTLPGTFLGHLEGDGVLLELWADVQPDKYTVVSSPDEPGLPEAERRTRLRVRRQVLAGRCTCTPKRSRRQGQIGPMDLVMHEPGCLKHVATMRAL